MTVIYVRGFAIVAIKCAQKGQKGQKDEIELLQQSQDLSVSQLIKELHNLKIESNENPPEFCVCKEVFYCLLLVGYVFYLSFVFSAAKCHRPK